MAQENQYLELQELQEPQRLRSTSSGRFGDQDCDTDSEVNYYNFLYVRPHSAPRKRLVVKGLSLPNNLLAINDFDITRFSYDGDIFFTIKQMQRMDIINPHWQRLTKLHWLLVELVQQPTKLKS